MIVKFKAGDWVRLREEARPGYIKEAWAARKVLRVHDDGTLSFGAVGGVEDWRPAAGGFEPAGPVQIGDFIQVKRASYAHYVQEACGGRHQVIKVDWAVHVANPLAKNGVPWEFDKDHIEFASPVHTADHPPPPPPVLRDDRGVLLSPTVPPFVPGDWVVIDLVPYPVLVESAQGTSIQVLDLANGDSAVFNKSRLKRWADLLLPGARVQLNPATVKLWPDFAGSVFLAAKHGSSHFIAHKDGNRGQGLALALSDIQPDPMMHWSPEVCARLMKMRDFTNPDLPLFQQPPEPESTKTMTAEATAPKAPKIKRNPTPPKEQAKLLGSALADGVGMALVDQVGDVFIAMARKLAGDSPFLEPVLAVPEGREAIKLLLAATFHTTAESVGGALPGGEYVSRAARAQVTFSTAKLSSSAMTKLSDEIKLLVQIGKQLESMSPSPPALEAPRERLTEDAEEAEEVHATNGKAHPFGRATAP